MVPTFDHEVKDPREKHEAAKYYTDDYAASGFLLRLTFIITIRIWTDYIFHYIIPPL